MSNEIITHKFRELLLPSLLIAMALNIASVVDASFVSTFIGHNAQAALQVLEPLVLLITIFEWLFGLGGQILALNKKAEFDEDGSNHYFTTAMLATIVLSILILLVCFLFKDPLINILHPPEGALPYVNAYGVFLFLCFPIATILGVLCQFIRVDGQPNFASGVIILVNIINIILDYVFLGVLHTGIEGASLAMLIGYIVGILCTLKYHFDSKRTFRFILSKLKFKTWITSTIEIIKIGLPGASMGFFNVLLIYVMNLIVGGILGELGLDIFNVCVSALLIISILIMGFAETLSSIVPIYYAQNDFYNLHHIVRNSLIITLSCALIFTVFLLVYPDGLLMFFKLHQMPNDSLVENAIRIYSFAFIPMTFSTMLLFYYEGIERTVESGIITIISEFLGPLMFTYLLYPYIGITSVWLSFPLGFVLAIVAVVIYVKIVERKDNEYSGLFFIREGLIEKTRNYTLESKNDDAKSEMFNHLESLNADSSSIETLDKIINTIFDSNNGKVHVEILLIDYDDKISINMKDEGKREVLKDIEKSFSQDNVKVSEVLGFNNVEYVINM
ncbi:MATE family efflux transporter [uncultured Methanobrevibacter sp.]|uniref:MATE family efflux transporter n=1 Tax=uncultured Methanobrevibacter sp. TaxID=253161 RepID=UPI0025E5BF20|nr:MATE family efflux transporter [uncultured Methanobrevibacter sp.]